MCPFELKKGEVLGIGGLAGQGQNELMLALAGAYADIKCEAEIKGRKVRLSKPVNAVRNGMLLVPGDRQLEGLFLKDSLYTNMIFPKLAPETSASVYTVQKVPDGMQSDRKDTFRESASYRYARWNPFRRQSAESRRRKVAYF